MDNGVKAARYVQIFGYILFNELERLGSEMMGNVVDSAGQQIVEYDYLVSIGNQPIDKMRTQKPGAACYQSFHMSVYPIDGIRVLLVPYLIDFFRARPTAIEFVCTVDHPSVYRAYVLVGMHNPRRDQHH